MSSTSTEASILCQHIIKNLYGPVVARVATILLDRGRLPFVQICRLLHPIKPQDVRYCLLILIQHHLIWHFNDAPPASAETDEKPPPGQDFFEPNPAEILHRLHFGAYIGIAEEIDIPSRPSLKGISAMIIFELLKHGRRRIKDLIDDVVNLEECKATFEEVRDTVTFLAGHRYVEASTPLQSSYPLDRYNAIRKEKLAGLTTAAASSKAKKDAERAAREEFIEERASDLKDANERMYADSYVGPADAKPEERKKKRPRDSDDEDEDARPAKRVNLDIRSDLEGEAFIRVNYARFLFKMRSEWIETAVRSRFGRAAALVIKACLELVENEIVNESRTLRMDSPYSHLLKTKYIGLAVGDLYDTYPHPKKQPIPGNLGDYFRTFFVDECSIMRPGSRSVQSWDGKRQPASSLIPQLCDHMAYSMDAADSEPDEAEEENAKPKKAEILPPKPKPMNDRWLEKIPENKEGAWRLQFHVIHKSLKRSIVFGIVEAEHGKEAIRIMRILDSWGRLEEKGVQKSALMTAKDVRKVFDALLDAGYIQPQECPRSADRVSSRSVFLWYIDWNKAYQNVRGKILQELGNIATRKAFEQEKHAIVLAKSQKPVVQANRHLMEDEEWRELEYLSAKMSYLRTAEARTMQDLAILDLPESALDDLLAV